MHWPAACELLESYSVKEGQSQGLQDNNLEPDAQGRDIDIKYEAMTRVCLHLYVRLEAYRNSLKICIREIERLVGW